MSNTWCPHNKSAVSDWQNSGLLQLMANRKFEWHTDHVARRCLAPVVPLMPTLCKSRSSNHPKHQLSLFCIRICPESSRLFKNWGQSLKDYEATADQKFFMSTVLIKMELLPLRKNYRSKDDHAEPK